MGIFTRPIPITFPDPDTVDSGDIATRLPDPGQALREWYQWAMGTVPDVVESEIDRARQPDGGYVVPLQLQKKGGGPLYLMSWIGQTGWISTQVWAQDNQRMPSAQKRDLDSYVHRVINSHGIPRTAACVSIAWTTAGRPTPRMELLSHLLATSYEEHSGTIPRGWSADVIKHWRP